MDFLLDTCGRRRYLLVMQLFVLNAAANCPQPKLGESIILTNEALLKNNFPEGSHATLQCANGLVKESGSGVMNCTGGNWTEPDLKCKKKDCGPPKPQPHMSFNISGGTLFGAEVRVLCDKGFQISGVSYKKCYASGWIGKAKCEIVTCEQPAAVANGITLWDSQDNPKYGEIIQFTCNEGYTLIGSKSTMCSESGEYDSETPECKDVTAEDRISPNTLTPPPAPPAQDSSTISAAHRDKSITTSATATVSPTAQGGRDSLTTEDEAAPTRASSTTSSFRDVTAEDRISPNTLTPPPAPPAQVSTSTDSSTISAAHRDKSITTSATATVSPTAQDKHDGGVNTYTDTGHTAVIVSLVCVVLVAVILVAALYRCYLRRKGASSLNGTVPIC
ncbi:complement decay-accelerating factor isoform X5 [Paralichthys olivaceus]|uniref:complement decay-accelerating factor isoform X5 n=1 Tax=Paralichthys olivaceus TaxID=8255 RepID=UPI00375171DE